MFAKLIAIAAIGAVSYCCWLVYQGY